jgi:hypothetical protein
LSSVKTTHLLPAVYYLGMKAGQCVPVDLKTSSEGRPRHLIPKTVQEWGKAGSQVILKAAHLKQGGARDLSSPELSSVVITI